MLIILEIKFDLYQTFAAEAGNQGLEIVSAEAFTADSNTDFSVQLQKAKDAGAELIFLPIYYTEASLILTQANCAAPTPWLGSVKHTWNTLSLSLRISTEEPEQPAI